MITRWLLILIIVLASASAASAYHRPSCATSVIATYASFADYREHTRGITDQENVIIVRPTTQYRSADLRAAREYVEESAWFERYGDDLSFSSAVRIVDDVWAFTFTYTVQDRYRFPERSRTVSVQVTDGEVLGILGDDNMRNPTRANTREEIDWALFSASEGRRLR